MDNENQNLFMDECVPGNADISASDGSTPPKITSTLNKGKSVIKPIAFKPLTRRFADNDGQRYGSTPILARPSSNITHYGSSHDLYKHKHHTLKIERKLRSVSPIAMSSLPLSSNHKLRIGYDSVDNIRKTFKDCSALSKSSFRTIDRASTSEDSGSLLDLTPSPSESNSFADMEAALRERDYELSYLRQTMEHNEQVIFKVYQEKEHTYERELRKIKTLHDNRLRAAAQKSLKLEQMLMMQTYQLQEEKKRLREENVEAVGEISALREEVNALRIRLEETEWNLCQKSGELAHIKSQLKDTQDERCSRDHDVLTLKNDILQLRATLENKETELSALRDKRCDIVGDKALQSELSSLLEQINSQVSISTEIKNNQSESSVITEIDRDKADNFLEKLKTKLNYLINEWTREHQSWEKERKTWASEKEKVLCYQKQLQISYIEMFRRNRVLETELENLTIECGLNSKHNHKKQLQKLTHPAIEL